MVSIDLNCDLGESFGSYRMGNDAAILPLITSANIACGFHAGDPSVMRQTVESAILHNVGIGAHPGLPDLQGFGRRELAISAQEAYDLVVYQIGALQAVAKSCGTTVRHVKAHGALYNMAAKSPDLAEAIVSAVKACDSKLIIVGLAGSAWVDAAKKMDMRIAQEVFADRRYEEDGSLTPRSRMDALIEDQQEAVEHVIRMVRDGMVTTRQGTRRPIQADTICIHGDGAHALEFAQAIRERFLKEGIAIERL
ncbi:lactam utilization protein LamB [Chryseomicrobium excrementi]|uniref:5-oxoprolinase subunit A n=1 Tax=Chryseomicrobium excrementi TaxID=2041346 RepID=A0A2M9EYK2_9BACL|nr:5-oxoprolinase subunit PxpA [Chryseomicrobium excrementi]PJK16295.1 lactam utilization protein LamB [Chryseomicrobium excrementi]